MECIPTKVETQQECFFRTNISMVAGGGPKEWELERHVDVKTPVKVAKKGVILFQI